MPESPSLLLKLSAVMKKLGLDSRPGVHVEDDQIYPQGRGVIFITLKMVIEITRFCRYDVLEITASGTRAVMVKPAVKREVVVTAKGIHLNTKNAVVLDYLGKFGEVSTNKVVYGVYTAGPLKGFKNGDRSYQIEIKPGTNLGSYHFIDSQKVSIRYPGQQQTCARCHQTPRCCRGKGMARKCEAEGGEKVEFTDHILDLWKRIGYSPDKVELGEIENLDSESSIPQQTGGSFTPKKGPEEVAEKFTGVSINRFPRSADHGEIMEFLVKCGLPESKKDNVNINFGKVIIKDLENGECMTLIEVIQGKRHFDQKMFCNGFIPLTPEKAAEPESDISSANESVKPLPPQIPDVEQPVKQSDKQLVKPLPQVEITRENASSQPVTVKEKLDFSPSFTEFDSFPSDREVIRRHSLSLVDRTPPDNSLAAYILGKSHGFASARSLLSQIADIQESLSDFNSCTEFSADSACSSDENDDILNLKENGGINFNSMNEKKREKKRKRKLLQTPTKDQFLIKKANTKPSPQ